MKNLPSCDNIKNNEKKNKQKKIRNNNFAVLTSADILVPNWRIMDNIMPRFRRFKVCPAILSFYYRSHCLALVLLLLRLLQPLLIVIILKFISTIVIANIKKLLCMQFIILKWASKVLIVAAGFYDSNT